MEARVCAYCKGNILTPITYESYKCKKCGSINYDVDKEINIKLANAQTELSTYNFTRADDIYKNILDNTTNPKVKAMALKGRICAHFGIVYVKGFYDDEVVATFANYDKDTVSIKSTPYYRELLECEISEQDKQAYIDELNELDKEYQKIKEELDKTPEYDVFICTKISARTKDKPNVDDIASDYLIASDFYDALEEKGLNVFLSKKSLKGVEYDGQIFSALMRSKVILVIATCKEYLESCWVESEWRRWLNFIDVEKRDIDTLYLYLDDKNISLPLILSSKKIQKFYGYQLIELLGKIYDFTKKDEPNQIDPNNPTITPGDIENLIKEFENLKKNPSFINMSKRLDNMNVFLENREWDKAHVCVEKILTDDPKCAEAYVGRLLLKLKLSDKKMLGNANTPLFVEDEDFKKAIRYSSEEEKNKLLEFVYQNAYERGMKAKLSAKTEEDYKQAAYWFNLYPDYRNSRSMRDKCNDQAEKVKYELLSQQRMNTYLKGMELMSNAKTEADFLRAAQIFKTCENYSDSDSLYTKCINSAEKAKINYKREQLQQAYNRAKQLKSKALKKSEYEEAAKLFSTILNYEDSKKLYNECLSQAESARKSELKEKKKSAIKTKAQSFFEGLIDFLIPSFCIIIAIGAIILDVFLTFKLKDVSSMCRWVWLPLIATVLGFSIYPIIWAFINGMYIGEWILHVWVITSGIWSVIRAGVITISYFKSVSGWGILLSIFAFSFVFIFNCYSYLFMVGLKYNLVQND